MSSEKARAKTVEEILAIWSRQPGAAVSKAELRFIEDMRRAAAGRVGYGWMKQVIDWEWQYIDAHRAPPQTDSGEGKDG